MLELLDHERPADAYGRGPLWVLLPTRGENASLDRRGRVYTKVGWYVGVSGVLRGAAQRLDGRQGGTGRLVTSDPSAAAPRLQASALVLPTEGCWRVVGRVAGRTLVWTFVARVKRSR
jgi:hypothetical protein